MSRLLTYEEHLARALMLGLTYDWRDGTYCDFDNSNNAEWMKDCRTLKVVSDSTAGKRRDYHGTSQYDHHDRDLFLSRRDNKPLPWEAP